MGNEVPLQDVDGRSGEPGTGIGTRDIRSLRDQDSDGGSEQRSYPYTDKLSPNMVPGEIMRPIKGHTSSKLFEEYTHAKKQTGVGVSGSEAISVPRLAR